MFKLLYSYIFLSIKYLACKYSLMVYILFVLIYEKYIICLFYVLLCFFKTLLNLHDRLESYLCVINFAHTVFQTIALLGGNLPLCTCDCLGTQSKSYSLSSVSWNSQVKWERIGNSRWFQTEGSASSRSVTDLGLLGALNLGP